MVPFHTLYSKFKALSNPWSVLRRLSKAQKVKYNITAVGRLRNTSHPLKTYRTLFNWSFVYLKRWHANSIAHCIIGALELLWDILKLITHIRIHHLNNTQSTDTCIITAGTVENVTLLFKSV